MSLMPHQIMLISFYIIQVTIFLNKIWLISFYEKTHCNYILFAFYFKLIYFILYFNMNLKLLTFLNCRIYSATRWYIYIFFQWAVAIATVALQMADKNQNIKTFWIKSVILQVQFVHFIYFFVQVMETYS